MAGACNGHYRAAALALTLTLSLTLTLTCGSRAWWALSRFCASPNPSANPNTNLLQARVMGIIAELRDELQEAKRRHSTGHASGGEEVTLRLEPKTAAQRSATLRSTVRTTIY